MIQWPAELIGQIRPLVKMIEPDASKHPEAVTRQVGAKYSDDDLKAELGQNLKNGRAKQLTPGLRASS